MGDEKEEESTSDENKDADDAHQYRAVTIQAAFLDLCSVYNSSNSNRSRSGSNAEEKEKKEEEATTTAAATIIIDEDCLIATTATKLRSTSISTELTLDTIHEEEEEEDGEDE